MGKENRTIAYEKIPEPFRLASYEAALLKMMFEGKEYNETNVSALFDGLDLDKAGTPFLILLAQLGRQYDWMYFPSQVKARASGVQKLYHVKNVGIKPDLIAALKALREADIDVMLLKGMTMQVRYDPGKVRLMHDADFTVRAKDLEKAKRIITERFDAYTPKYSHDTIVHRGLTSFELQHSFINFAKCSEEPIWERAELIQWMGIDVYIPSPEDELVLICDNDSRDYENYDYIHMALKCLYDAAVIISNNGIEWSRVAKTAAMYDTEYSVYLVFSVLRYYLPGLIPDSFFETLHISEEEADAMTGLLLKFRKLQTERMKYKEKNRFMYRVVKGIRYYPIRYRVQKWLGCRSAQGSFVSWFVKTAFEWTLGDGVKGSFSREAKSEPLTPSPGAHFRTKRKMSP